VTVDARADVYALGAMLYESLGGSLPITADSPPICRINPHASRGLSDVIARCIADRAEDRYADTASLADDLRRHLTNQPLAGVRNRSLAERWQKWRRRRPNRLRLAAMLAVLVATACVLVTTLWSNTRERHEQAELALYDGQQLLRRGQHQADAINTFNRGIELLDGRPFEGDLRQQLRDQLATARRLQLASQLHQLADEIRILYGSDTIAPPARLASLAAQCDAFWQKRSQVIDALGATGDADIATDFQDIAIFAAGLHARLSSTSTDPQKPLRYLNEAEAMFGPSAVLQHQRGIIDRESVGSPRLSARTAWEHYALGRSMLVAGDLPGAATELDAALKLDPAGRWPNFYYGLCAYRGGRFAEAVSAFSVCIGAAPDVAGCYYNRGLAYAALGRHDDALRDYDRALRLDPAHAAAALNRGMLHFKLGRSDQATADLRLALQSGADAATVHYDLALIHMAARDPALALNHVALALKHNPTHEQARQLRDAIGRR
jgi:eukaryotic-like serine/threonine-protein kinase